MASTSPPSVMAGCQIHIPLPARAERSATRGAAAGGAGRSDSGTTVGGRLGTGSPPAGGLRGGGGGQPVRATGPRGPGPPDGEPDGEPDVEADVVGTAGGTS